MIDQLVDFHVEKRFGLFACSRNLCGLLHIVGFRGCCTYDTNNDELCTFFSQLGCFRPRH
jgi:hypothetical protein